jgi:hypothetical protein
MLLNSAILAAPGGGGGASGQFIVPGPNGPVYVNAGADELQYLLPAGAYLSEAE